MGVALIAVAAVLLLLCWGSNTVVFIACCHLSDELLYHLQRQLEHCRIVDRVLA